MSAGDAVECGDAVARTGAGAVSPSQQQEHHRSLRLNSYAFIYGPVYGVVVTLALGPAVGLALSLRRLFDASSDVSAASPASTLHDDTMSAILQASMGCLGLGVGAGIALYVTIKFGVGTGIAIGAAYGLVYGISIGFGVRWSRITTPAFMPFAIARTWLAVKRKLPWSLMPFLEDAHKLGVLRQQGAVYQFRHATLQEYLATPETMPRPRPDVEMSHVTPDLRP